MATLSGNKIKDTYQSLVKFSDNGNITVGAKQLTDGFGNNSPIFVSTTQVGIGVTPESGLNLHVYGDAKIGSNLTVIGNLVVEGSTTTVGTDTLTVKDPLIVLANNNTSTDAVDIGFYGKYTPSGTTLYSGLFREALTGKYRLFKDLQIEPTTTVNTSGTGYAQATLIAALEGNVTGNVTGNLTGNVTGGTISGTTGTFSGNVDIDGTLDVDNVINIEGSAFGRIEIGGASGGYIDLKAPNSDDYDFRIITSSGGNEITTATGDLIFNTAETLALTIDTSQDATFAGSVVASTNLQAQVESNGVSLRLVTGGLISWMTNGSDQYNTMSISGNNNTGLMTFRTNGDDALVIDASQNVIPKEDLRILDNKKATFGNNNDLEIYHDGGNGFIKNTTGQLNITDSIIALRNQADNENMLYARENAQVELYYDNSIKLATTNTGITVTGDVDFTGNINIGDNQKILFGDGGDIEMFFNGSTFVIDDTVEALNGIDIDTNLVRFRGTDLYTELNNGQHTFWINGTQRFQINSTEVDVSHNLSVTNDLIVDTDTLFVDTSEDSVGIGLTNPSDYSADELVISVPDDSGMTLVSGTTDTAYIRFADGTGAADQANFISHDHNTNTLTVFSQAKVSIGITEAEVAYFTDTNFYVDKSTTIDDTLTVNNNATFAGDVIQSGTSKSLKYWRRLWADANNDWGLNNNAGSGVISVSGMGTPSTSTTTFEGSVGIGSFPTSKLQLEQSIVPRITMIKTGVLSWYVGNPAQGSSNNFTIGTDSGSNLDILTLDTSGNSTFTGRINGVVGGTAYNTAGLWLQGNSSTDGISIGGTGGGDKNIDTYGGALNLQETAQNGVNMWGNVGIGVTSPSYKLTVADDTANGRAIQAIQSATSGTNWGFQGGAYGSGATKNIGLQVTAEGASTNYAALFGGGNVGIGTTSPDFALDIEGLDSGVQLQIGRTNTSAGSTWMGSDSNGFHLGVGAYGSGNSVTDPNGFTVDTSGNVGIGTDSPAKNLEVAVTGNNQASTVRIQGTDGNGAGHPLDLKMDGATDSFSILIGQGGGATPSTVLFCGNRNGNVGIGTSTIPTYWSGYTALQLGADNSIFSNTATNTGSALFIGQNLYNDGSNYKYTGASSNEGSLIDMRSGIISFLNAPAGTGTATVTERMRINSSGNLCFGKDNETFSTTGVNIFGNGDISAVRTSGVCLALNRRGSDGEIAQFYKSETQVGNISVTSSATAYNTSSDYRLKENVVEMTGALDRIGQLKPSRFNFISDADKTVDGFLAHEVQEIVPEAITGEKDGMRDEEYEVSPDVYEDVVHPAEEAVYETIEHPAVEEELDDEGNVIVEGKEAYTEEVLVTEAKEEWTEKVLVSEKVMGTREVPDYQGIDQSKLVPLLVGAIQELKAEIESLKSQINN